MCTRVVSHASMPALVWERECTRVCATHSQRPRQKPEARHASLKCKPKEQIAPVCMYVCMYSPVNSVESVTRQQCGHVMLYLPSKTAVLSDLLTVLYVLTFVFTQLET